MRAFIGIALPPVVRSSLATLQRQLAASRADVKWVEPANLHVTLKFLDEISDDQRQAVIALLARVAEAVAPFPLGLEGLGAFPSVMSPRILWVGLAEGREAAAHLGEMIEQAGRATSLRREERPFAAHLTIGRVRSARHLHELAHRLRSAAWQPPPPWRVTSLTLYQSRLGSEGPRYTLLADLPLGTTIARPQSTLESPP